MKPHWWLRTWRGLFRRKTLRQPYRPTLEFLEKRDLPSVFTVNTNLDENDGGTVGNPAGQDRMLSLREAIEAANATGGSNTINFSIGTATISLANALSALPAITNQLTLDGGGTVTLDGSALTNANGLILQANSCVIEGLTIQNFPIGSGILVQTANNTIGGTTTAQRNVLISNFNDGISLKNGSLNLIEGNFIGIAADGATLAGNGNQGIELENASDGNTISGNVISGNSGAGVFVGDPAANTLIVGNLIGTNAAGTAIVGNGSGIIRTTNSPITIGGTTAAARNIISGNSSDGIDDESAGMSGLIEGNFIGTDITGKTALLNGTGILLDGSTGVTIGGATAGAGNLISGNAGDGILIQTPDSTVQPSQNLIEGNLIGSDITGLTALPNGGNGINLYEATNNTIGGTTTAQRNIIIGNGQDGILLNGAQSNLIEGDFIGIAADGATAAANGNDGVLLENASNSLGAVVASNNTITASVISGNESAGIETDYGVTGTLITGNRIGTNAAGTAIVGNTTGIFSLASGPMTIGGTTTADRNVISGNSNQGIVLDFTTSAILIEGNFVGTDINGTSGLGNGAGILLQSATNAIIGGTTTGARNVISGNVTDGIVGLTADAITFPNNNLIEGNFIGTNAAGTGSVGNGGSGVDIIGGSSNTIGGTTTGAGNVISGNSGDGITLDVFTGEGSQGPVNNLVAGNFIGTDSTGLLALGNGGNGITVNDGVSNVIGTPAVGNVIAGNTGIGISIQSPNSFSASNVVQGNFIGVNLNQQALGNGGDGINSADAGGTIGGVTAGAGNVISSNAGNGIDLNGGTGNEIQDNFIGTDTTTTQSLGNTQTGILVDTSLHNDLSANDIFANGNLGIRLINNGNNNQIAPTLTGISQSGGMVTINWAVNDQANPLTPFRIDFFANSAGDPSGSGQGQKFLGTASGTTDSSGNASGTFTFNVSGLPGFIFSATATPTTMGGPQTSPFSPNITLPTADLAVSPSVSDSTPFEGETISYLVQLDNLGPNNATGITVSAPVPPGLTFVFTASSGLGSYNSSTGLWTLASLPSGANTTLNLTVSVQKGTGGSTLTGTATIQSSTPFDPNTANNSASVQIMPKAAADLAVQLTPSDATPFEGETITLTVALMNNGPDDASNITVSAPLPTGLTFVSATGPGTYTSSTGAWTLSTLTAGNNTSLVITATVNTGTAGSTLTVTATRTASTPTDPNSGNDTASVQIMPQAAADLAVSLHASDLTPFEGETITCTVGLTNNGPDTASSIVVSAPLPTGLTFVSATGPGMYDPAMGIWTVSSLTAGNSATLTITATVDTGTAGSTLDGMASRISSTPTDPNATNDLATVQIKPQAAADLAVSVGVSDTTPTEGETITYTVGLTNNGPDDAGSITVSAPLPTGLTFVSATGAGTYDSGTGTWTLTSLTATGTINSATLTITATVNAGTGGTTLTGTASLQSSTPPDPNNANNSASVRITPQAFADLAVTLAVSNSTPLEGATITCTIGLSNLGPNDAGTITVQAPLPTGLAFVSASGSGSYDPGTGTWTLTALAKNASATLTLTVTVNAGTGGKTLTGTATASAAAPSDPNLANNTATVSLTPRSVPVVPPSIPVVQTTSTQTQTQTTTSSSLTLSQAAAALLVEDLTPATTTTTAQSNQSNVIPLSLLLPLTLNTLESGMSAPRPLTIPSDVVIGERPPTSRANSSAKINGVIFEDTNGDGVWQTDELPLEGMAVYLDMKNSGEFDDSEPVAYTDSDGRFVFLGLVPGTYRVRVVPHRLFAVTFPDEGWQEVSVSSEGTVTVKFGCKPLRPRNSLTTNAGTLETPPPSETSPGDAPGGKGTTPSPGDGPPGDGGGEGGGDGGGSGD